MHLMCLYPTVKWSSGNHSKKEKPEPPESFSKTLVENRDKATRVQEYMSTTSTGVPGVPGKKERSITSKGVPRLQEYHDYRTTTSKGVPRVQEYHE